ncbi:MAG: hydrogenase subunit beta, partial [Prevotellaceae bacterium]|nr:hydrogenase subunit beta [Prevotellaceae bacterium]
MEQTYISREALKKWLTQLNGGGRHLYAPAAGANGKVDFRRVKSADEVAMGHVQTTQSPKGIAFPRVEKLFSYTKEQGKVAVQDYDPTAIPETVLFGLHPCDAAGFGELAAIFGWDGLRDKPFDERRKRITVVSLSCTKCDEYCFCTSLGGSPGSAAGSDLLLTPLGEEGYLVELATDKGRALVEPCAALFAPAPAAASKEAALAKVPVRFDVEALQQRLPALFD